MPKAANGSTVISEAIELGVGGVIASIGSLSDQLQPFRRLLHSL